MASDAIKNDIGVTKLLDESNSETRSLANSVATTNSKHFCPACSITFSRNSHLKRHLRTQHGQVFLETPNRGSQCSLWCPLCGERFTSRVHTENHIVAFHQIEICRKTLTFHTEEEFTEWKNGLEREEGCFYVSTKGESRLSNGTFAKYYHCHRCGKYQTTVKGERKRRLKLNGTIKIGTYCPARIKRFTTVIDAAIEISVEYVSTHIGHGKDTETSSKRKRARQQQENGSKDNRVLKNLQSTVNRTKKVRKSSKKEFNIDPSVSFKQMETNVPTVADEIPMDGMTVTKINESSDPVIFLYQPQCEGVTQWNEYQERVPQEMVVVNPEPEKSSMEDSLARRKNNFLSILQVAASKIDNAISEQHFDIIDRFAMAIVNHLDGFAVQHVVQDNVTYQVLGPSQ